MRFKGFLLVFFALIMLSAAPVELSATAQTLSVYDLINNAPENSTVIIPPGTYYADKLPVKTGQTLVGDGVTLTGGIVISDWVTSGDHRYADVSGLTNSSAYANECLSSAPRCHQPNTLWDNDTHLLHVTQLSDVTSADRYYIDYAASRLWVHSSAAPALTLNIAQSAFDTNKSNLKIIGFTIENYASKFQRGAIYSSGRSVTLDEITLRRISGTGAKIGAHTTITNSRFENVLQLGLGTTTPSGVLAPGIRVTQSVFAHNGNGGVRCDWEGGALKLVRTIGAVFSNNHVHDNCKGVWFDIDNDAAIISHNLVEYNSDHGIFWEISARALIECNVSRYNGTLWTYSGLGGSQIHVSSSGAVMVRENLLVLSTNGNGLTLRGGSRGSGIYPWVSEGNLVQNNTIVHLNSRGISGLHSVDNLDETALPSVNLFDGNTYYAPEGWTYWYTDIDGAQIKGDLIYAQSLGHEPNGRVLSSPPLFADSLDYLGLTNWPLESCGTVTVAPSATPTPTSTFTLTPSPTPSHTATLITQTSTPTATETLAATQPLTNTSTHTPTVEASPSPTITPTSTPTALTEVSPTLPTQTADFVQTPTPSATDTGLLSILYRIRIEIIVEGR